MKAKDIVIRAAKIFALIVFACVSICAAVGVLAGIFMFDIFLIIGMAVLLFLCICVFVWILDQGIVDDWLG